MHEDRATRAARRKVRNRWLGLHVFDGIHADTQVRQKRLGKRFAQLVINRGSAGSNTVATAITAERTKERTVGRARMLAVQTGNDMHLLLERLQRFDRLRKNSLSQRTASFHSSRDTGRRIHSLVLHEKDHPFWTSRCSRSGLAHIGKHRSSKGSTEAGCDRL